MASQNNYPTPASPPQPPNSTAMPDATANSNNSHDAANDPSRMSAEQLEDALAALSDLHVQVTCPSFFVHRLYLLYSCVFFFFSFLFLFVPHLIRLQWGTIFRRSWNPFYDLFFCYRPGREDTLLFFSLLPASAIA
jgi:hypothetical protein